VDRTLGLAVEKLLKGEKAERVTWFVTQRQRVLEIVIRRWRIIISIAGPPQNGS